MNKGFLVIDGNNIGYASAATKKLKVGEQETQAIYGFLRTLQSAVLRFPMLQPIVLWDGFSWRKQAFKDYKANRDKEPETPYEQQQAEIRASFKSQQPFIKQALKLLAVPQMIAANLEADDLAAILVRRYQPQGKKILLLSGDKDWIQLVQPGVGWLDPQRGMHITPKSLPEKLGYMKQKKVDGETVDLGWVPVRTPRAWLEIKALMGDTSDEIPGVGGIGEKGAIELLNQFGSVAEFWNRANTEGLKLPKKLADFASDEEKIARFHRNMMLMDLNSKHVPAPEGLKITKGEFDQAKFGEFCEDFMFKSFLTDLDEWCKPFAPAETMKEAA